MRPIRNLALSCLCALPILLSPMLRAQGPLADTPEKVSAMQAALIFLDYKIDAINGIYGPQTTRAVEAFEFFIGMGTGGELSADEYALLEAQVIATSFERFGYRLAGYWSPMDCAADTDRQAGLWLSNLGWRVNAQQAFPLQQFSPEQPLVYETDQGRQTLASDYLAAANAPADVWIFPLDDSLRVRANGQVFELRKCARDISLMPADYELSLFALPLPTAPEEIL